MNRFTEFNPDLDLANRIRPRCLE